LGNISLREALLEMSAMATPKPAPFPWHVMCVSIVASLNNMAFGYDVGVISGAWRPPAQVLFWGIWQFPNVPHEAAVAHGAAMRCVRVSQSAQQTARLQDLSSTWRRRSNSRCLRRS